MNNTNFKKLNNIVGWVVCIIACTVYMLTKENSASFWDCGEFLSGSYKLEVVHSPGAPLFLMLGRMFTMFAGPTTAAAAVNTMNALVSGFTILFLFWSITHFVRRIYEKRGEAIEGSTMYAILASGVVGGLAYTFSDTFWFSAVEGEVYAMSSFLTALVFWAILKWEDNLRDATNPAAQKYADRWVIFIFYIMGLSIGVHLLNLLVIPAIIMVYFFNKYEVTPLKTFYAFLVGCAITGLVQFGIIQGIPILAGKFDVLFVNEIGMPFNIGVLVFFVILTVAAIFAMRWAKGKGYAKMHLAILSFLFIVIGYSSFVQIIIRSNADIPIDMTNPDNALSLTKYLQREQYGKVPLLFGPDFTSRPSGSKEGGMEYFKGKDKYEELGTKVEEYTYDDDQTRFFPRVWDANDGRHVQYYQAYCNLAEGEAPTTGDNFRFFFRYQMMMMYWRYFLWNYVGRENDIQKTMYEPDQGNWISGIKPIDKMFGRGDIDKLPAGVKDSPARNELYGLPFILGLIGLYFHYKNDKRNALIVFLLFFFTGAAIVIYLNNVPLQPRERDYAYVGSMYAFAIWIGMGVAQIYDWLKNKLGSMASVGLAFALTFVAVPMLMAKVEWNDHDRSNKTLPPDSGRNFLESCEKNAILFTEGDNDTYPLWYMQEIEGVRTDVRIVNISLLGIDWYIDQLRRKVNDADALPMNWKSEDYRGEKRNYAFMAEDKMTAGQPKDLNEVLAYVNDDKNMQMNNGDGVAVVRNRTMRLKSNTDSSTIIFELPVADKQAMYKNDLAILNIVAKSFGKRPIYFANTIDPKHYEGLYPYLTQEGILFKLGTKNSGVTQVGAPTPINTAKSYDLFMKTYKFGNAQRNDVFYDQTNRRMLNIIRTAAARIADGLIAEGKKKEAIEVLDHCMKNISEKSYLYSVTDEDRNLLFISDAYLRAGAKDKAKAINEKLYKYVSDDIAYTKTLTGENEIGTKKAEIEREARLLTIVPQGAMIAGDSTYARELSEKLQAILSDGGINLNSPQQ